MGLNFCMAGRKKNLRPKLAENEIKCINGKGEPFQCDPPNNISVILKFRSRIPFLHSLKNLQREHGGD